MDRATPITPDLLRGMPLPQLEYNTGKEGRGRALVVGGSTEVPGAVLLAGAAALRAGAGKLQIATCRSFAYLLGLLMPEARVLAVPESPSGAITAEAAEVVRPYIEKCQAVLVGPGMMDEEAVANLTADLLDCAEHAPFVLDAAAFSGLCERQDVLRRHGARLVITPHIGEMAGFLKVPREEIARDQLKCARDAAASLQTTVALKGASTYIAAPDGPAWCYEDACVGLATSGSGDVLAGVIAGLLARGAPPAQAAIWGVYLHAEAGRRLETRPGHLGFLARELLPEIPAIMSELG